jgi:cytochrome c551/c552
MSKVSKLCGPSCETGYYGDTDARTCKKCHQTCKDCIGPAFT